MSFCNCLTSAMNIKPNYAQGNKTDLTFTGLDYELHGGCLIRNRNCLPYVSTWTYLWFYCGFRVGPLISLSRCVCIVLCVVPNGASVSLDCPFLIAISVLSKVHIRQVTHSCILHLFISVSLLQTNYYIRKWAFRYLSC